MPEPKADNHVLALLARLQQLESVEQGESAKAEKAIPQILAELTNSIGELISAYEELRPQINDPSAAPSSPRTSGGTSGGTSEPNPIPQDSRAVLAIAGLDDLQGLDLRSVEEKLRLTQFTVDRAVDAVFWVNHAARILYANEEACRRLGYTQEEMLQLTVHDIDPTFGPAAWADHWQSIQKTRTSVVESAHKTRDGRLIPVEIAINYLEFNGREYNCAIVRDVRERRRAEGRLRYAATHDRLTGLANRTLFLERLQETITKSRLDPAHPYAVFFLDFDRFKLINDSMGHETGDQFLREIANRLEKLWKKRAKTSPPADAPHALVARLGGDEFAVLLEGLLSPAQVHDHAEHLQNRLSRPFEIQGHEVFATVSIGIVVSGGTETSPDELLRDADIAMYRAKSRGRACHVVFDQKMHEEIRASVELENDLRRAVERAELRLFYQPIISLDNGSLRGFEALIRWQHPQHGFLSPDKFIPLAEETGLIIPIGQWVIETACRQLRAWQNENPSAPKFYVSVNLSKRQLVVANLLQTVQEALRQTDLTPGQLKLEVTESTIVQDAQASNLTLTQLQEAGVGLMMDDFGTGHSSLSRLHLFPIETVKIDRAFLRGVEGSRQFAAVIQAIITLAHNLKLQVVAEGVETEGQLAQLIALECDAAQGYYFAKPMPPTEVVNFLLGAGKSSLHHCLDKAS
ncbi:MAG: EAL domain-containing protein [Phycisphaeraceae bacterium]|nr:EAL domain-containing protein [Phycisphaeraceae bacterium]